MNPTPIRRRLPVKRNLVSVLGRKLMWRLGRKIYAFARGDGLNDPRTNGEYWLLDRVMASCRGPVVLLDVGANRGDWTAQALRAGLARDELHVHAFEPSESIRGMLTARFESASEVSVQPFALSDKTGEGTFYNDAGNDGTSSLFPVSGSAAATVQLKTLDDLIQEMGIDELTMVKIDTEGFDLLVLKGGERALRERRIEVIQFEYNWRWLRNHASLRDVFDFVADKPYRLGKLAGERIEFFGEWHFELDRYFENNYVLVREDSALGDFGVDVYFDDSNSAVTAKPNS
jgi:FkbM family methyltransferase